MFPLYRHKRVYSKTMEHIFLLLIIKHHLLSFVSFWVSIGLFLSLKVSATALKSVNLCSLINCLSGRACAGCHLAIRLLKTDVFSSDFGEPCLL